MKLFVALVAIVSVAAAAPVQRYSNNAELEAIVAAINSPCADPTTAAALEQLLLEELGVNYSPIAVGPAIIEANPISVGPAIIEANPISVGPAIIEANPISVGPAIIEANPISVGPAIIDFPLPDGGDLTVADEVSVTPVIAAPIVPSPAVGAAGSSLVQIIVNVNKESEVAPSPSPVAAPSPVIVPEQIIAPGPVNVVEGADNNTPISPVVPTPVVVVNPIFPGPVNVIDGPETVSPVAVVTPVFPTPIQVGTPTLPIVPEPVEVQPIVPSPAVVLPETLN